MSFSRAQQAYDVETPRYLDDEPELSEDDIEAIREDLQLQREERDREWGDG